MGAQKKKATNQSVSSANKYSIYVSEETELAEDKWEENQQIQSSSRNWAALLEGECQSSSNLLPHKNKRSERAKKKDTDQSILHPCFLFSVCAFFTNPHKYTTAATVQDKAILQKTHFILSSTKIWNRNDHKSLIENSYR